VEGKEVGTAFQYEEIVLFYQTMEQLVYVVFGSFIHFSQRICYWQFQTLNSATKSRAIVVFAH
jgi:hypothetical protein